MCLIGVAIENDALQQLPDYADKFFNPEVYAYNTFFRAFGYSNCYFQQRIQMNISRNMGTPGVHMGSWTNKPL